MSLSLTIPAPNATPIPAPAVAPHRPAVEVDNRATYASFGLAYVLGHGASALSQGATPLLDLPGWLPTALLGAGLAAGTVSATLAAARAQRAATGPDILVGKMLGASWIVGFAALFLAITGLTNSLGMPGLQSVLWPTGSGLVVGLLYLAEGAVRRNPLHYGLGVWLALISTAALLLGTPALFWVLTLAGGGAYALATVLESRRLRALA
ncbi:ABC transporter permease [Streptomyces sp. NBC_01498]|uniref:ABC transporter permease n=1 Tax=Streptomyces sp. NBC_01498 TaxID=2975870 RepID=UPI002E7C53C4|nr:ABC transporter permease [Streptomyces sp. NBC_01498]WTL25697.1 ABC transporter permease [Streptomyces sp. NBC_01498]